ncbi:carboxypeptidase-like regulatory domain-containing protein [Neolewinella antarctica]|uniref:Carboxypeptidase-like regulatory domain-containing protein n=1 Tax=Neolewinella antarctica TaxID=442734 RepID=A0ABX0XEN6_9BACT|nr:carboxypeptidase-like regulatory domain-containing protein [Neolewinella antarctica]NJC27212.1 hypothetical protein [Neolewinella antarctica]
MINTSIKILLFFLIAPISLLGQNNCQIIDEDGRGIPYVNVYLPSESSGVLSDENGHFTFPDGGLSDATEVVFSCLNFKVLTTTVAAGKSSATSCSFALEQENYELAAIEVTASTPEYSSKWLGVPAPRFYSRRGYNLGGSGSERAVLIENKKKGRLDRISVFVSNVTVDSFNVEVNIYDFKDGVAGGKLQKERIFVTIAESDNNEAYEILVKDLNLYVTGSFLVSVTMLNVLDGGVAMLESVVKKKHEGFEHRMDGRWVIASDAPCISALVSYPK